MSSAKKILEYSALEEKYAEELRKLATSLQHPVLQALFLGIAKDSEKHSLFYKSIAKVLGGVQPLISEEDLKKISETITKHIELEARMMEEARTILEGTNDPRVKLLAAAIYEDEAKHHKLLVNIKEKIAEAETLTEQVLWDMIWKDSPWHGAPGG